MEVAYATLLAREVPNPGAAGKDARGLFSKHGKAHPRIVSCVLSTAPTHPFLC